MQRYRTFRERVDPRILSLESVDYFGTSECFTVTMSSRDPMWMTPLVKSLLRQKSRISTRSADRVKVINKRISVIICENRGNFLAAIGTHDWWKRVDDISQRFIP